MKSRVTFDLDGGNNPIILVHAEHSEDVRDKIARQFVEKFGHTSNVTVVSFKPTDDGHTLYISPLPGFYHQPEEVMRLMYDVSLDQLRELKDVFDKEIFKREIEHPEFVIKQPRIATYHFIMQTPGYSQLLAVGKDENDDDMFYFKNKRITSGQYIKIVEKIAEIEI